MTSLDIGDRRYQTLGARFIAGLIDTALLIPFLLVIYLGKLPELAAWLVGMAMIAINISYFVILHGRSGQTIGKRIMNVRVVHSETEGPISYLQALWRESPIIIINVIFFAVEAALFWTGDKRPSALLATMYAFLQPIPDAWWISDAATTLFNSKRRSLHDFIGATVVVRETDA